jgi:oligopeptidase A
MTTVLASENPLLIGKGLPPFDRIETLHVVPAMTQLLTELEQRLSDLEVSVTPTWQGLVEPLTQLEEQLTWA